MSKIRLLLAWLVMAALPLQGFAATSMLFCGLESASISQSASGGHAGHGQSAAAPDTVHVHAEHGHGAQGHPKADPGSGKAAQADQDKQGEGCPVCASCCHVVALGAFEALPLTSALVAVESSASAVRVFTRAAAVPDKPPRA